MRLGARALTSSPFSDVRPALAVAGVAAVLAGVWPLAGAALPGGRWTVVHLLTLGVITPLVLAFSQHFARTLTHSPSPTGSLTLPTAIGTGLVLAGLTVGPRWVTSAGGLLVTGVVVVADRRLRQARKDALGARFAWVVRVYERAHGAFILGATLGVLMGLGVLSGPFHATARTAHVHVMLLGWAGLTILASLVFLGPTMLRARIEGGAEATGAVWLPRGATALIVAVVLLVASGIGGIAGDVARVAAAAGLGVLAWAAGVVCRPVGRLARTTRRSPSWPLVAGLAVWFPVTLWADVLVVGSARWALLTPVGVAALTGVVGQAMLATLVHVLPLLGDRDGREAVLHRLSRTAALRGVAWNLGAILSVVAVSIGPGSWGSRAAVLGWGLAATAVATTVLQSCVPAPAVRRPRR